MPTASAPAHTVVVTDPLDTTRLNLATFSLGPITFAGTVVSPPAGVQSWSTTVDLRPAQNLIVSITASLDRATGVATWRFQSLDPSTLQPTNDVDDGFLPANVDPPTASGW